MLGGSIDRARGSFIQIIIKPESFFVPPEFRSIFYRGLHLPPCQVHVISVWPRRVIRRNHKPLFRTAERWASALSELKFALRIFNSKQKYIKVAVFLSDQLLYFVRLSRVQDFGVDRIYIPTGARHRPIVPIIIIKLVVPHRAWRLIRRFF
jgi:hypothetical protein